MITLQILFPLVIIKYMKFLIKGQIKNFLAAHFAKRNTKFGGGESEGGAGIPFPPILFPSRPARASVLRRAKRGNQFRSK